MTSLLPVFVYGTLRTGQGNYNWALAGRTLHETPATLSGARMYDNNRGFPFVTTLDADPTDTVTGDLMVLDPDGYRDVMRDLDGLEGYFGPGSAMNMYDRVTVTVTTADGTRVQAHTYLVAPGLYQRRVRHLPRVEYGDWLAYLHGTVVG